jgi:uncharacterized protein
MKPVLSVWHRRKWRADAAALRAYDGVRPLTIVTGGSEGIGFALAERFAAAGDELLLVARDAGRLAKAAETLGSRPSVKVSFLAIDITAPDSLVRLDAHLAKEGAYCRMLINSAGIGLAGDFATHDPDKLAGLVDLNIKALTALTRHYLPGMLARGDGGILNVASLGGYAPGPYQAAYYASKAYVISLSEALAHECAGHGVRISVLCPGPVRTAFHQRMGGETGLYLRLMPVSTPEAVARTAYHRYRLGQRVIIPGVVNTLMMPAMRLMPHRALSPIVSALFKPRKRS